MNIFFHSWPKKKTIVSIINPHLEQLISSIPWLIELLLDKIQEFINLMGPFYQSSYEDESVNDKNISHNISTTTSANVVTMESIKQMFQKMIQDNNSK